MGKSRILAVHDVSKISLIRQVRVFFWINCWRISQLALSHPTLFFSKRKLDTRWYGALTVSLPCAAVERRDIREIRGWFKVFLQILESHIFYCWFVGISLSSLGEKLCSLATAGVFKIANNNVQLPHWRGEWGTQNYNNKGTQFRKLSIISRSAVSSTFGVTSLANLLQNINRTKCKTSA